jgi:hypothetical protein
MLVRGEWAMGEVLPLAGAEWVCSIFAFLTRNIGYHFLMRDNV